MTNKRYAISKSSNGKVTWVNCINGCVARHYSAAGEVLSTTKAALIGNELVTIRNESLEDWMKRVIAEYPFVKFD